MNIGSWFSFDLFRIIIFLLLNIRVLTDKGGLCLITGTGLRFNSLSLLTMVSEWHSNLAMTYSTEVRIELSWVNSYILGKILIISRVSASLVLLSWNIWRTFSKWFFLKVPHSKIYFTISTYKGLSLIFLTRISSL